MPDEPHVVSDLERTPLYDLHLEHGGRMGGFAGYDMPIRYEAGPMAEHLHTRSAASLFDVAHMGVVEFRGDDIAAVGEALETVLPSAITTLAPGKLRYSFLTNDRGGVLDDLMIANDGVGYTAVVNAGTKADDVAHFEAMIGDRVSITHRDDLALLALQGPSAVEVLSGLVPGVADLTFLTTAEFAIDGAPLAISRSGYTGEDGFEITISAERVADLATRLLAADAVEWAGLAARDTLRLEAGMCLYGHDLDPTITPIEADLTWAIQKRRRAEGGFPGAEVIQRQMADGTERLRVGLAPEGRRPVRDESTLYAEDGTEIGVVTSGGYGPSVERPIAMGYVSTSHATVGTRVEADVRGKRVACVVADLPFSPHRYVRPKKTTPTAPSGGSAS